MDKSNGLEYINQMFPSASLLGVETLVQKVHSEIQRIDATIIATVSSSHQSNNLGTEAIEDLVDIEELLPNIRDEIRRVDATIQTAIRQQRHAGTKAKGDLCDAARATEELCYNIQEIKSKADQSEATVQETCGDIQKLDFAKKNITSVITPLHCLTLLVSAVVQLQVMATKRQYKEAAAQLVAVNQLCNHYEANTDVPNITDVIEKLKSIKQILKSHVFSDFSILGTVKETEETNLLKKLSEACLVVDTLEPSVREELVNNFCNRELTSYENLYAGAELTNMDEIKWIYDQIIRQIQRIQEIWIIFPASWHVPYRLYVQFCKKTREQVESVLVNTKEKPDVETLLLELKRTIKFEKELEKKLGGGVPNGDELKEIGKEENGIQNKSEPTKNFNLVGMISACFEPHLTPYIEKEERELMQCLEKVVQVETWDIDEDSQINILSSCRELFFSIKNSYDKCKALTKRQTLFSLVKVFQRVLKAYATKLLLKLPKQIKVSERDERLICYIVNSAEYCHKTSGDLAEEASTIIDPHYAEGVDMEQVQNEFSAIITKALVTLVRGLETKFDTEMEKMTHEHWSTLESVGDHSKYVNGIDMILNNSVPLLRKLLTPLYFQLFLDKLVSSLGLRFYANIFRCKKISEIGAEQMLLDKEAIEMIFLKFPSLDRQVSSISIASYTKFVKCQMSRAEAVLKVILSPIDSVIDTYSELFPEGTLMKLQHILELKGVAKADQRSILDDFNNLGSGSTEAMPQSPVPPLTITIPAATKAPTTGYKKFIDRPLRKLFIA